MPLEAAQKIGPPQQVTPNDSHVAGPACPNEGDHFVANGDAAMLNSLQHRVPMRPVKDTAQRLPEVSPLSPSRVSQRLAKAYGYAAGGLAIMATCATLTYCTVLPALLAFHSVMYVAAGVIAPLALVAMAVVAPPGVLRHALWVGFNVTAGIGLSVIGFWGAAALVPAAICATSLMGILAFAAHCGGNSKNLLGMLQVPMLVSTLGLTIGGTVLPFLVAGAGFGLLQAVVTGAGLTMFSLFTLSDMERLETAAKGRNFDPLTMSLTVYVDMLNIFANMARALGARRAARAR